MSELDRNVNMPIKFCSEAKYGLYIYFVNKTKVILRLNVDMAKPLVYENMSIITGIIWPYFRRNQVYNTEMPSVRIEPSVQTVCM